MEKISVICNIISRIFLINSFLDESFDEFFPVST